MVRLWGDGPGMIKLSHLTIVHNKINPEKLDTGAKDAINKELSDILAAHVPLWKDRTEDLRKNTTSLQAIIKNGKD